MTIAGAGTSALPVIIDSINEFPVARSGMPSKESAGADCRRWSVDHVCVALEDVAVTPGNVVVFDVAYQYLLRDGLASNGSEVHGPNAQVALLSGELPSQDNEVVCGIRKPAG
jgi:hypothetical protein